LCRTNDLTTDKGRLTVVREMAEAVRKTGNTVLVDKHAQKTALRLGVAPDAVRKEFNKAHVTSVTTAEEDEYIDSVAAAEAEQETIPRPAMLETWLLKLTLRHDPGVDWLAAHLDPGWIQHPHVRDIVSRRLRAQQEGNWRSLGAFLDGFESASLRSLITEMTCDERAIPNPDQQLADVVLRIRNQFVDQQMAALTQQLSQPGLSDAQNVELLQHLQQWRQFKKQPLGPLA
jgi:DNA primase